MAAYECYHCKSWIEKGTPHDCWTTTEAALTKDLSEDLREAWERLRETAVEFGEQRTYASHNSIMFSRASCYCFVRPRRSFLELWVFLGRTVIAPQIRRATPSSKTKVAHLIQIRHRDEVEPPVTEWMREAYQLQDRMAAQKARTARVSTTVASRKMPASRPLATVTAKRKAATRPGTKTVARSARRGQARRS